MRFLFAVIALSAFGTFPPASCISSHDTDLRFLRRYPRQIVQPGVQESVSVIHDNIPTAVAGAVVNPSVPAAGEEVTVVEDTAPALGDAPVVAGAAGVPIGAPVASDDVTVVADSVVPAVAHPIAPHAVETVEVMDTIQTPAGPAVVNHQMMLGDEPAPENQTSPAQPVPRSSTGSNEPSPSFKILRNFTEEQRNFSTTTQQPSEFSSSTNGSIISSIPVGTAGSATDAQESVNATLPSTTLSTITKLFSDKEFSKVKPRKSAKKAHSDSASRAPAVLSSRENTDIHEIVRQHLKPSRNDQSKHTFASSASDSVEGTHGRGSNETVRNDEEPPVTKDKLDAASRSFANPSERTLANEEPKPFARFSGKERFY